MRVVHLATPLLAANGTLMLVGGALIAAAALAAGVLVYWTCSLLWRRWRQRTSAFSSPPRREP